MALPFLMPCRQEAVAQAAANGSATNSNNKRQLEGDEPSSGIKRQKSGSGTEALTKDGSAPLSAEEVRCSALCLWCAQAASLAMSWAAALHTHHACQQLSHVASPPFSSEQVQLFVTNRCFLRWALQLFLGCDSQVCCP